MKKVLVIAGNTLEIGQTLTNLFGMNEDIKIIHAFVGQSIRPVKSSGLITPGQQQYEPITTIFLVYTCKGDLQGMGIENIDPVKARVTN